MITAQDAKKRSSKVTPEERDVQLNQIADSVMHIVDNQLEENILLGYDRMILKPFNDGWERRAYMTAFSAIKQNLQNRGFTVTHPAAVDPHFDPLMLLVSW